MEQNVIVEQTVVDKEFMSCYLAERNKKLIETFEKEPESGRVYSALSISDRIPVGVYILKHTREEALTVNDEDVILVYPCEQQFFTIFVAKLEQCFIEKGITGIEVLEPYELDYLLHYIKRKCSSEEVVFQDIAEEDLKKILMYYATERNTPVFYRFSDEGAFDITKLAYDVWKQDLRIEEQITYLDILWENSDGLWRRLYDNKKKYFLWEVYFEIMKIAEAERERRLKEQTDIAGAKESSLTNIEPKDKVETANHVTALEINKIFDFAISLQSKDKKEAALHCYKSVIALDPTYIDAYLYSAFIYEEQGKLEVALENLTTAEKLSTDNFQTFYSRGLVYKKMLNYDAAEEDFYRVIHLNPDFSKGYYNLGYVMEKKGMYDAAVKYYDLALAQEPDLVDAIKRKGDIYRKLKNYIHASKAYQLALSIKPDFIPAKNSMKKLQEEMRILKSKYEK